MPIRYFIELAYDGTDFHGWQIQPNGISVQGVLQDALSLMLRQNISVTGAGRTDTGVHATYYVAHFDTVKELKNISALIGRLNRYLGRSVAIFSITPVIETAHARFDAIERSYEYHVILSKNPFLDKFSTKLNYTPDWNLMNICCRKLIGTHDFTSFSKLHTDVKTNICRVYNAYWEFQDTDRAVFNISADRFLRNMVRAITGTLLDVGRGKITEEDFSQIFVAKNRNRAGMSMPPQGLFLTNIKYPDSIFRRLF